MSRRERLARAGCYAVLFALLASLLFRTAWPALVVGLAALALSHLLDRKEPNR